LKGIRAVILLAFATCTGCSERAISDPTLAKIARSCDVEGELVVERTSADRYVTTYLKPDIDLAKSIASTGEGPRLPGRWLCRQRDLQADLVASTFRAA